MLFSSNSEPVVMGIFQPKSSVIDFFAQQSYCVCVFALFHLQPDGLEMSYPSPLSELSRFTLPGQEVARSTHTLYKVNISLWPWISVLKIC